ncbi:MAG: hypothetical protein ABSD99_13085, partial [Candidatus Bathyarchaeia archaeon]
FPARRSEVTLNANQVMLTETMFPLLCETPDTSKLHVRLREVFVEMIPTLSPEEAASGLAWLRP